jgi:hypothetical protein
LPVNWAAFVSAPEKFAGRKVQLLGWVSVAVDGEGHYHFVLWLNREAFEFSDETAAVSLDSQTMRALLPKEEYLWPKLHGEAVMIQGTFKRPKDLSLAMNLGTLEDIDYFVQRKPGSPFLPSKAK